MVKIAHGIDASSEIFKLDASPAEGQSHITASKISEKEKKER